MPRLYPLWSNFSSGEWSPKLEGQVQLDKYQHACRQLTNYTIQQQGGVIRRPGTRWVSEVVLSTSFTRLIPFVVSVNASYMLEMGAGYIRFYRNGARIESGGVPVEAFHTFLAAELRDVDVRQSVDVLYFFHPDHPTQKLERYSDTIWRLREVDFNPPPTFEFGTRPVATLTPGATSGTTTFATSVPAFQNSDVGREILVFGGSHAGSRATITAFTNTQLVTGTITQVFQDTTPNAAADWKVTASPMTILTPTGTNTVGSLITLTLTVAGWRGTTALADSDCGRFVIINGGEVEITTVTSTTVASGILRGQLSALTAAQSDTWTLEEAVWSALNGFGETASFHDDRFYIGSGFRFSGSKSGDYENFGVGVLDDDAVIFAVNSDQLNTIRWLMGTNRLLIGASGGEFSAFGGNDSPITPSNVQVASATTFGSNGVGPMRANNVVLFVNRSGTKLREFIFDWANTNNYVAPDLLLLAEHLTSKSKTIVEMAYRQDPDSIVWVLRSDGVLLGMTYLRDQSVVGWHRHTTSGAFESVATIPTGAGGDQTWVIVNRTINGVTRRFVEVLDDTGLCYNYLNTDCTFTCDSAVPVSVFNTPSLVSTLLGATVKIVADGAVYPDQVVTASGVTIDPPARQVEVGLGYDSTLEIMRPEIPSGAGTMQAQKKRWAEIFVRVLNTLGITITANGGSPQQIPFRTSATLLGDPPALFSGDKRLNVTGWDDTATVTIQQTQPLPSNILLLSGILDLGG